MTAQAALALPPPRRAAMGRADFVVTPANAEAAALMAAWTRWPDRRLGLCGPERAGKTHLAHVFMAEAGAGRVDAAALTEADAPALLAAGALAVEDVDRLEPTGETALLHLMNLAAQQGAALLLTGRAAPARWPARLPDLASRLAALTPARLAPPDDALLTAVIARALEARGLRFEATVPAFLSRRIERSFAAAEAVVARLDRAGLERKAVISRRLAGRVLACAG